MSSMAKLKDSRCFITRWLVFYKCVQLVQGLLRSFQSPSSFFLILEKKKISYVFLFLRNFKISFPSVFTVYFGLFLREKRRKNLTINLNNFLLTSGGGICDALRESPWRARCTWEATYAVVQRHHIKMYLASFFFFKSCKIYSLLTYVKITVKKC